MNTNKLFGIVSLTTVLGISLVVTSADAQRRNGNQGNQGGNVIIQVGPGAANQGIAGAPIQIMMPNNGNIIDPAKSAKFTIVYRVEVQNALGLDLKQKIALDDLKNVQAQNQQKMGQELRGLVQTVIGQPQNLTPDERQQKTQELTEKVQGISQGFQSDLEKRVDAILTPRQRKRLNELDLRWRGPMSLVDPTVAEQAKLGETDKKKATDSYKEFTDARQKLFESMMPGGVRIRSINNGVTTAGSGDSATGGVTADPNAPPAAPVPPPASMTPAERQAAQKKAFRDLEKNRVALGTKLVANVSPPLATTWQEMIGAPFTFREDNP
ncbi:MAG: hypothetical protein JWN14_1676 [Chthonomonadales bacterium]|nr:hypothetical protein [Chthonomonadales bacterium]